MGLLDIFKSMFTKPQPVIKNKNISTPAIKPTEKKHENLMEVLLSVVGLKYENEDGTNRQEILKHVKVGEPIQLKRTPMADYPNAIQVLYNNSCIGYISEYDNKRLAKYLDGGGQIYEAEISRLYENSKGIITVCEIFFYRNKMR